MSRTGKGDLPRSKEKTISHVPSEDGEHAEMDFLDSSQEDATGNTSITSSSSEIDVVGSPKRTRKRQVIIQETRTELSTEQREMSNRALNEKQRLERAPIARCRKTTDRTSKKEAKNRSFTKRTEDESFTTRDASSNTRDRNVVPENTGPNASIVLWTAICVCIFALFLLLSFQEQGDEPISEPADKTQIFKQKYQSFMSKFPSQTERFFRVLKAASRQIVEKENPSQPAVFIFVFSKNSIHTSLCLSKHFLKTLKFCLSFQLSKTYEDLETPEVFVSSFKDLSNAADVKMALDDKMHTALTKHQVVAVHDIHLLPGKAALMFHSYCDNDNAPFKKASIVLTLEMPEDLIQERMDEAVEKHLTDLWGSELETDQLTAVLSRVANNVAVIKPEEDKTITNLCES